jgi:xylose isomerase
MHFNDNHGTWDDDMIVGSVHSVTIWRPYTGWIAVAIRAGFHGSISLPEDGLGAIGESILWLCQFDAILQAHRPRSTGW